MSAHFMLDLETMGTRSTSAVVAIGCVHFDEEQLLSAFYTPVSLASCLAHGLVTDQDTIRWWGEPAQAEARKAWDRPDAPSLPAAIKEFNDWMLKRAGGEVIGGVWGNGSDFDLPIISNCFHALEADPPWKFWSARCYRTLKNLVDCEAPPFDGDKHNAVMDARHQARHLQMILKQAGMVLA